ncbi:hypothetical protein [Pantoea agglomerans]
MTSCPVPGNSLKTAGNLAANNRQPAGRARRLRAAGRNHQRLPGTTRC